MSWISYQTNQLKEKYLYRFLSKDHLFDFLEKGSLWFSRADQFNDKMECVRIQDLMSPKPSYENIEKQKERFLINCWHLADNESLALWDTYASTPGKRRIAAIRFRRLEVIQLIKDGIYRNDHFFYQTKWVQGKVLYKNMATSNMDSLSKSLVKYPAFRKEAAFSYEQEYRFVVELTKPTSSIGFAYLLGNSNNLPFNILINPLLNKEEYSNNKKEIENKGFHQKIVRSSLERWLKPELW